MASRSLRLSWKEVLLHSAAGISFSLILWATGLLNGLEADTYDLRVNLHANPSSTTQSIVLVRLDQESLDHVERITKGGVTWPWPRQLYAAVINNCTRRGAKAIGFDVIFSEDSWAGVTDDKHLSDAIRNAGTFALGSVFPTHGSQGGHTQWPDDIPRPSIRIKAADETADFVPSYPRATFPIADIVSESTVLSNIQHREDRDGIYRRLHPLVYFDGEPLPSLGVGMYLAAHPQAEIIIDRDVIQIGSKRIPIDDNGMALLHFRGPSKTFPYLHAGSLIYQELQIEQGGMDPDVVERDLEGKYVLFGFTATGLYDAKTSPTGKFSGPEINATMLDNLLANDFIAPLPAACLYFSVIGLTLLSCFFISLLPSSRSHVLSAVMFILLPGSIAIIAFRFNYNYIFVPVQIAVTAGTVISVCRAYFLVHGQEKFIRHSFKHYLSPVVIDQLITNPERLKLGGERKELTLFFSDLEGFTKISEGLEPEELTHFLNEYLTAMTDIILEEEGTVDKFEGDAIIAFWNAPLDIDSHSEKAVKAALRCQEKLAELRPYFLEHYGKKLSMRIGINTGFAVVGNMGSSSRFDYSVLGDAVNLAARLEGANKYFGTRTMISSSTFDQLGASFHCREIGRLKVVGRNEPVTVYEPLSYRGACREHTDFNRGLALFYEGNFSEALELFQRVEKNDPAAKAYCIKCKKLLGREVKWSGIWELDAK